MKKRSIASRITLWYVVFMLVIAAVLVLALSQAYSAMVSRTLERSLVQTVENFCDRISSDGDGFIYNNKLEYYTKNTYISVYDEEGELVVGRRPRGFNEFPQLDTEEIRTVRDEKGGKWHVYDTQLHADSSTPLVIRGMINDAAYEKNDFLQTFIFIMIPILVLVAGAGGWLITRKALMPLNDVIRVTNEISRDADLSRRVRVPETYDEVRELAESANSLFDRMEETFEREKQFTSDVSHELRTPLAVIRSESEYAMEDPEYAVKAAGVINRESRRLSGLLENLLTISKSDAGRLRPELSELDLADELESIAGGFRAGESGSEVRPEFINEAGGPVMVMANEDMLIRVIFNLLDNAVKYGRSEGSRIWIRLFEDGDEAVCVIADNGDGIAADERDRIWQRFYQTDSSRTRSDSMGLGLSMVEALTKAMDGKIRLLTDEEAADLFGREAGAAFELRLPLSRA